MTSIADNTAFRNWFDALEARHLSELTFAEVRRALQALSRRYVGHRDSLRRGAALDGAGKRAAYALFYGPLHFLAVRHIVDHLLEHAPSPRRIVDLGCGSGAASAAWALATARRPRLFGSDLLPWALEETRWTWEFFGLTGRTRRSMLPQLPAPEEGDAFLAAYAANELGDEARERLLTGLLAAGGKGARVLVVEPIARRGFDWWKRWAEAFEQAGGRSDLWRFPAELPGRLRLLDRAAGLDHQELTARSLLL